MTFERAVNELSFERAVNELSFERAVNEFKLSMLIIFCYKLCSCNGAL